MTATFFTRLPPEIRQEIYELIMPPLTVAHIRFPPPRGVTHAVPATSILTNRNHPGPHLACTTFCHIGSDDEAARHKFKRLIALSCLRRNTHLHVCHQRNAIERGGLGVLGWLLSCRRAYNEFIAVLYSGYVVLHLVFPFQHLFELNLRHTALARLDKCGIQIMRHLAIELPPIPVSQRGEDVFRQIVGDI